MPFSPPGDLPNPAIKLVPPLSPALAGGFFTTAPPGSDRNNRALTRRSPLVAQMVKHLPTVQETRVRPLGGEDPLEKEMATPSSTLAWEIPWDEPGRLQSMGSQRVGHD